MSRGRIVYFCFAAMLALVLFWPPLPGDSQFFDFDRASPRWLARGWARPERDLGGGTFTWAESTLAELRVEVCGREDRAILFRSWTHAGTGPQTVTVRLNRTLLGTLPIGTEARAHVLVARRERWRHGTNSIRMTFARTATPLAGAPRALAAAFDWIQIVPLGP